MASRVFFLLLLACGIRACTAWGVEGHQIVCTIAQSLFEESTTQGVTDLLSPYKGIDDFVPLCLWADWAKRGLKGAPYYGSWSSMLHYADSTCSEGTCFGGAGGGNCEWHYTSDCVGDGNGDGKCVAGAINNYTRQLTKAFAPSLSEDAFSSRRLGPLDPSYLKKGANLTEALLFVSHFVGDSHQPLHAGFVKDKGGNDIDTTCDFCGVRRSKKENLHAVWDDGIIERAIRTIYADQDTMAAELEQRLADDGGEYAAHKEKWLDCGTQAQCSSTYVEESEILACKKAYVDETGTPLETGVELSDDYYTANLPVVEQRLAQAGLRLAYILNNIFAPQGTTLEM